MPIRALFVLTFILAILATAVLAIIAWWNRRQPGVYWFAVHTALIVCWTIAALNSLIADTEAGTIQFGFLDSSLALAVMISWFLFILTYLGYGRGVSRRVGYLAVFVPSALYLVVALTPATRSILARDTEVVEWNGFLVYDAGLTVVTGAVLLVALALFLIGIALTLQTAVVGNRLNRMQALLLSVAILIPLVSGLAGGFAPSVPSGVPLSQPALVCSVFLYAFALYRYELFTLTPATERIGINQAFDSLAAGVVVANEAGRVLEINDAGCRAFGTSAGDAVGTPIDELFASVGVDRQQLPVRTEIDTSHFWITDAPITNDVGETIGHSLLVLDITDQRLREQRLAVLDRILRHNIRNHLTVIMDSIEVAAETVEDEQLTETLQHANEASEELLTQSDKARQFEMALRQEAEIVTADLRELLTEACKQMEAPETPVSVDVDAGLTVETNVALLSLVLQNLIENAVVHTDETPRVEVLGTDTDSGVRIEICDNGPGIPEHELAAIRGGEETALDHGSGLGLWLVTWATPRLGGTVEFQQTDTGTVVVLRIPDQSAVETAVENSSEKTTPVALE